MIDEVSKVKRARILLGIALIFISVGMGLWFVVSPQNGRLILFLLPVIVWALIGLYTTQLKKYPSMVSVAEKMERAKVLGLRRGRTIGIVFGILYIVFIIIYFFFR